MTLAIRKTSPAGNVLDSARRTRMTCDDRLRYDYDSY
jgi:hypothetical protein